MAEGVGFEPTVLSYNGFQDRRLKPLGHPSLLGTLWTPHSMILRGRLDAGTAAGRYPKGFNEIVAVNIARILDF